jgi:hypothetical protein
VIGEDDYQGNKLYYAPTIEDVNRDFLKRRYKKKNASEIQILVD